MNCGLRLSSLVWIVLGLLSGSVEFDVPTKHYEISKRAGEGVRLKCESEKSIDNFIWKKKRNGSGWNKIYSSKQGGFLSPWNEFFSVDRHDLIARDLNNSLGGTYVCVDYDVARTVSNITLEVFDRCSSSDCPQIEDTPYICPTLPPIPPVSIATTFPHPQTRTQVETKTPGTTAPDDFVSCEGHCQEHQLPLLCRRDEWKLTCGETDPKCNLTVANVESSTMKGSNWQMVLHLSLHGFMLLLIVILLIYIFYLKKQIGRRSARENYEIPTLSSEETEPHKYATSANTYDFIADVRPRDCDYEKYLKLKSAKDSELPPIPDYLEIIT